MSRNKRNVRTRGLNEGAYRCELFHKVSNQQRCAQNKCEMKAMTIASHRPRAPYRAEDEVYENVGAIARRDKLLGEN